MTMSIKNWIARIAFVVLMLAGTPTHLAATDGLDQSRYLTVRQEAEASIRPAARLRANLNQNPFRSDTVQASLAGEGLQVQSVVQNSSASILGADIGNLPTSVADTRTVPVREAQASSVLTSGASSCRIQIPDFTSSSSTSWRSGLMGMGENVVQQVRESGVALFQWMDSATERQRSHSSATFQMAGFRQPSREQPQPVEIPVVREVVETCPLQPIDGGLIAISVIDSVEKSPEQTKYYSDFVNSDWTAGWAPAVCECLGPHADLYVIGESIQRTKLPVDVPAIISEPHAIWGADKYDTESTLEIPLSIDPENENSASRCIEGQLLIEQYLPVPVTTPATGENEPTALSIPAMMICHSSKATASEASMISESGQAGPSGVGLMMRTAKSLIRSLIELVEPFLGVERAMELPTEIRQRMFQIDEWIWSTTEFRYPVGLFRGPAR